MDKAASRIRLLKVALLGCKSGAIAAKNGSFASLIS